MKATGHIPVSTDKQAELGVSLEAQEAKIRAMATVQGAELFEVIVESAQACSACSPWWTAAKSRR